MMNVVFLSYCILKVTKYDATCLCCWLSVSLTTLGHVGVQSNVYFRKLL